MIQSLTHSIKAEIRAALKRAIRDDGGTVPLHELIPMLERPYIRDLAESAIVNGGYLGNIISFSELNTELRRTLYDRMIGGRDQYVFSVLEFITRIQDHNALPWVVLLSKSRGVARRNPELSRAAAACAAVLRSVGALSM